MMDGYILKILNDKISFRRWKLTPNFLLNLYPFPATSLSDSIQNAFSLLIESFATSFPNLDILLLVLLFGLPAFSWLLEVPPCPSPFLQLSFRSVLLEEVGPSRAWRLMQTFPFPISKPIYGLWIDPIDDEVAEFGFTFTFFEL